MKKAKQWEKPEVGVREFTKPPIKAVLSPISGTRSFLGYPVGPPSTPPTSRDKLSLEAR